jgi:cytochrome c-type biogenesis protein CcmH/NrfF
MAQIVSFIAIIIIIWHWDRYGSDMELDPNYSAQKDWLLWLAWCLIIISIWRWIKVYREKQVEKE